MIDPQFYATMQQSTMTTIGVREAVLQYILEEGKKEDIGTNIHDCIRILVPMYSEQSIRDAIKLVEGEGYIYSTTSADYYKYAT
jgi:hypothetical protein